MKIAILTLQIIERPTNSNIIDTNHKHSIKSVIEHSEQIQITNVFASRNKTVRLFLELADKFRSEIL